MSVPEPQPLDGIAIVGMSGRFPGARNVDEFWHNLVAGKEAIERLSDEQLASAGLDVAALRADASYVPARGRIERPEWFDAAFFGITPREAEAMDPQQRVFLEEAWAALEDAGCDPTRHPGAIGVFAGMSNNTYWANNVAGNTDLIEAVGQLTAMMGNEKDYLATRVAYKFNLRGPALNIYTACSTSLVAVCQACTSLLNYQCDAALAGGISITFPQERGYQWTEGGITSPDGHCRAFDVNAAGTVFSSGVGVVVLKRLADAVAEGDQIYAVIRGAALNNDGSAKVSFTAPSVDGHAEVIALAQALAGVAPETISYIEAHGTGTPLGDPIEIAGLTQAFRAGTDARGFCAIGAVKTNIGHLDAAAGVAGLIKTALALRHGYLPGNLHFTAPNPKLELEGSPFRIATEGRAWPTGETPRRAGVSSFGVGGTNAHVVLEECGPPLLRAASQSQPTLIVLSARNLRALEDATTQLGHFLHRHPELPVEDVAFTLQQGRRAFGFRRFVVADSAAEAGRWLLRRDRRRVFTTLPNGTPPPSNSDDALVALGHRWLAGEEIDWAAHAGGGEHRKVSLPTYPFERQRYWAEPVLAKEPERPRPDLSPEASTDGAGAPRLLDAADPLADITAFLGQFSGLDMSGTGASTTLVELGLDSLFLTQIAIALQKKFGLRLRFRQLLEELGTLGVLAEYLRANSTTVPVVAAPARIAASTAQPASAPVRHGPFRRIDTTAAPEITAKQQRHIDALIARYTERTAGSKRYTAQHRAHFADPRAVSGFRRALKEIVYPLVADRSLGARLWDIDGHEYVDITLGFGQILFGHRAPFVVAAIEAQLHRGIEIGPTSPLAGEVAALMCELTGMDRTAFCNTGSEAVMAAIRMARTVTGRDKIAVFAGAYHGIFDEVLVRPAAGDSAAAIAPGIPDASTANVLVLEYGSDTALDAIRRHAHELAAVLVEPVQSRQPELQPREFLHELRRLTAESDIALVMDEVVTGFRCHPRGAQGLFGIKADIGTYGKVLGGGLPIGIVAGDARFLDALDGGAWNFGDDSVPEVGVTFFAGTFVRHPLALAAAKAVLTRIKDSGPALQEELNATTERFVAELNAHLDLRGVPLRWMRFSSCYHLAIPPELKFGGLLFHHLRLRGVHAWEGRPCFLSTAHTADDLAFVAKAFRESVDELVEAGLLPCGADRLEFPLTEAQQELHLAARMGPEASASFNESITIHLRGSLDPTALGTALNRLVARHETLRTTFSEDGLIQRVAPTLAVALPLVDLAALDAEAQARALDERIEVETTTPFDLARGPLLRTALVKLAEDRHDLVLTVHHIVCDGWSFATATTELAALYSGRALAAPCAFREYARWLGARQAGPDYAATEEFWLRQFSELPPPMELPTDHSRGSQRSYRGARCATLVPRELHEQLKRFSAAQRCTLFTTMLAAFHVLLHRLTGQDDLTVGIAAAGQSAMGRDDLTGHCLNFLPIRARMAGDPSFTGFLGSMRTLLLDAFDHQDQTFGALLQKLALPRDPSRMPLLGAMFNIDRGSTGLDFTGLAAEFDINPKLRLNLDISFNLIETERGTQLYCAFNRDLFEPETMDRWLDHYLTLLGGIVTDAARPLSRLPMLSEAERHRMLREWNTTRVEFPEDALVHELFEQQVERTPDAVAMIFDNEELSYRDLNARANQLAHHLRTSGVAPGASVGLCLERSPDMVAGMLAILKAGAAYVPLDPIYPRERIADMIADSGATIVLTQERVAGVLPGEPLCLEHHAAAIAAASRENPSLSLPSTSLAYLIYTSGSTGKPKGIEIEHRAFVNFLCSMRQTPGLSASDTVLAVTTICFDIAGLEIFLPLITGARLHLLSRETAMDPARLAEAIETATVMQSTPATWRMLLQWGWRGKPALKILCGGEAVSAELTRELLPRCGELWNMYGPTETTIWSTCQRLENTDTAITIGRPIANTEIYVLDAAMQPQPPGVTGALYIGGAGLARGYHGQAQLTQEKFVRDPFSEDAGARLYATGDMARWRADGQLLCLGRSDHQVKIRGFRIELGEIETALLRHSGIAQCAVVAVETRTGERGLAAYLVSAADAAPTEHAVREFLLLSLPTYMVPSAYVWLEALPLTANGKLNIRNLPQPDSQHAPHKGIAPRNPLEQQVAALWTEVLGRNSLTIHDDFFTVGGHSLLAIQLISRIRERFAVDLPVRRLFEGPTIESMAGYIAEHRPPIVTHSLVPIQRGDSAQRPFFLVPGGWGGELEFLVYGQLARHLGPDLPFYGLKAHANDEGRLAHESVGEMAATYLDELRTIQPRGPYQLGGECIGGIVAHEMARLLAASGEKVELLVLLDTEPPSRAGLKQFLAAERNERWQKLWQLRIAQPARDHLAKLSRLTLGEKFRYIVERATRLNRPRGNGSSPLDDRKLLTDYPRVLFTHTLQPYSGKITLVIDETSHAASGTLGWEKIHRGVLDVHVLPGDHISYIREHRAAVAAKLRELILHANSPTSC